MSVSLAVRTQNGHSYHENVKGYAISIADERLRIYSVDEDVIPLATYNAGYWLSVKVVATPGDEE